MSAARKCDRCGAYYDPYTIEDDRFAFGVNGIAFAKISSDGKSRAFDHDSHDLCKRCFEAMHDFFKNPEQKHGLWISYGRDNDCNLYSRCSECNYVLCDGTEEHKMIKYFKFCPKCGARMDAGEDQGGGGENATD